MSLADLARQVDTTAICDADRSARVVSADLRCRSANPTMCGPAVTVHCPDDLFGVVQAIEAARPGDVVVVDGGGQPVALAGEIFTRAALGKGLAGIVVDGGYRDLGFVSACSLPVYSRHVHPSAAAGQRLATVGAPVTCGGVTVHQGDVVVADREGMVVLDAATAEETLLAAAKVKELEARVIAALEAGGALGDCVNSAEHARRLAAG